MCGRFTQHHDTDAIVERFGVQQVLSELEARYNIAPTQPVPVVVTEASSQERFLDAFRWGLIPSWAKDPSIGNRMINARAESVAEKPAFKSALMRRRCILPSDGFYEWDKAGGTRQPYYFRRKDGGVFGYAGLWEEWRAPEGGLPLRTCTILTTSANETVGRIHDRMPVILQSPEDEAEWLDPEVRRPGDLLPLLAPYPDAEMEAIPVSRRVNSPANDAADLIRALTAPEVNSR